MYSCIRNPMTKWVNASALYCSLVWSCALFFRFASCSVSTMCVVAHILTNIAVWRLFLLGSFTQIQIKHLFSFVSYACYCKKKSCTQTVNKTQRRSAQLKKLAFAFEFAFILIFRMIFFVLFVWEEELILPRLFI